MHKTKKLLYKGTKVDIDIGIAPLILDLWKLGINTTNCCQGQCRPFCKHKIKTVKYKSGRISYKKIRTPKCNKYIWIVFNHAKDAEKFYNYIAEYDTKSNSMYSRMHGRSYTEYYGINNWILEIYPVNRGEILVPTSRLATLGLLVQEGCGKNNFNMMVQLYFPRKHLPYVSSRIKLALLNQKK